MMSAVWRQPSLVLVASATPGVATRAAERLNRAGYHAVAARSARGCLRVATAIGPDLVLLDVTLPRRVEGLLRAHPVTARTRVLRGTADTLGGLGVDALAARVVAPQRTDPAQAA